MVPQHILNLLQLYKKSNSTSSGYFHLLIHCMSANAQLSLGLLQSIDANVYHATRGSHISADGYRLESRWRSIVHTLFA